MVHWLALLLLTGIAVAWVFDFSFPNDEITFSLFLATFLSSHWPPYLEPFGTRQSLDTCIGNLEM
jgi:hypothetical protein